MTVYVVQRLVELWVGWGEFPFAFIKCVKLNIRGKKGAKSNTNLFAFHSLFFVKMEILTLCPVKPKLEHGFRQSTLATVCQFINLMKHST